MAYKFKNKKRRRSQGLSPTQKTNLIVEHFRAWQNLDRETRMDWLDYKKLIKIKQ